MDFSVTERAKLAIWYDVFGSVVEVQRKFRVEFNDRNRVPSKDLILASHETADHGERAPEGERT